MSEAMPACGAENEQTQREPEMRRRTPQWKSGVRNPLRHPGCQQGHHTGQAGLRVENSSRETEFLAHMEPAGPLVKAAHQVCEAIVNRTITTPRRRHLS